MQSHLYFICPTDGLETVINNTFRQENYYFTSLGNSIVFDEPTVGQLNELLQTKNIREISFVLSDNNRMVLDAIEKKDFSKLTGLNAFYDQIAGQKEHAEVIWQSYNRQFLILSYYLNSKIEELRLRLTRIPIDALEINAKIYHRHRAAFSDIYSDLICKDYISVN